MMKRCPSLVIAGILSSAFLVCAAPEEATDISWFEQNRSSVAVVDSVDSDIDLVVFVDTNGELWAAEVDNIREYAIGSEFLLTFDKNGTDNIYDDIIVGISGI